MSREVTKSLEEPVCLCCGEPEPHPGAHFDGTYFLCDPEAPPNTDPYYDHQKDGNRG